MSISEQSISHQRLDRFISKYCQINRKAVKLLLAQKRIKVDDEVVTDADHIVHKFSKVVLNQQILQNIQPTYLMLHKPVGVVSATKSGNVNERLRKKDPTNLQIHPTVIDIIDHPERAQLHLVGRLDLNTSGLLFLTNDSRWSERLASPENKVPKHYIVTLKNKLTSEYITAFEQGLFLPGEGITTLPAKMTIIDDNVAKVSLIQGRNHQIKRMFGCFNNPVIALHREAIGNLSLGDKLKVGESRVLTAAEIALI